MIITIQDIPHSKQRLGDVGDWIWEGDTLTIRVSDTGNKDSNFLIAAHELIEAYLCKKRGITTELVDKFDESFNGDGEPGHDKDCPYRNEHIFSEEVEMLLSKQLKIDWDEHEKLIEELYSLSHERYD